MTVKELTIILKHIEVTINPDLPVHAEVEMIHGEITEVTLEGTIGVSSDSLHIVLQTH